MLIYLIQHWVNASYDLLFPIANRILIATLDTFTDYNGTSAIIKVMILGLILTSLLFIKKMMQTKFTKDWKSYFMFATPIIIFILIAGGVATLLQSDTA